jgi:hypothetical protein
MRAKYGFGSSNNTIKAKEIEPTKSQKIGPTTLFKWAWVIKQDYKNQMIRLTKWPKNKYGSTTRPIMNQIIGGPKYE